jgi:thymidylate synthase
VSALKLEANWVWLEQLNDIRLGGLPVSPRGIRCRELLNQRQVVDMRYPLVTIVKRNVSLRLAATEALWILTGDSRLEPLLKWAPSFGRFSDDGLFLAGAYGPKFIQQYRYVVRTLVKDPDSRQAVMTFWERNPPESRDIPCTISHEYLLRSGHLHLIANMRSNDIWLGWPYDIFSFTMMALFIALHLPDNIQLGWIYLNVGSQHLYQTNEELASGLSRNHAHLTRDLKPLDVRHLKSPGHLMECLRATCLGDLNLTGVPFFDSMIL